MIKQFLAGLLCLGFLSVAANNLVYAADGATVSDAAVSAPVTTPEVTPSPTGDDLWAIFHSLGAAIKSHSGRAIASSILMLLLFLWRRFGSKLLIGKIPDNYLPLLASGISMLAALPAALIGTTFSWGSFITDGLLLGAQAIAFWSLLGKFVLPQVFGQVPSTKLNPQSPVEPK